MIHQSPRQAGQAQTRWTLKALRKTCVWWQGRTLAGVWKVLQRLELHWLRGRDHIHSPDAHYQAKLDWVGLLKDLVQRLPEQHVLLWQDELTYYRQPTLSATWEAAGDQARAERSYRSNAAWRVVAALNPADGRVHYGQAKHIDLSTLIKFYGQLCDAYPNQQIWLVQDNWPLHFHPQVLAALQPQESPFLGQVSWSWRTMRPPPPSAVPLPIQLVPLPTYAPWCNPIEKLWRKLKQDVLHLHPWADDLQVLRQQVALFLEQFAHGSPDLLRYVGLLIPS